MIKGVDHWHRLLVLFIIFTKCVVADDICSIQEESCPVSTTMTPDEEDDPVQVFILLGQSNMLGMGNAGPADKPGTLEYLMHKEGKYSHLKNKDNNDWVELDNVRYVHVMQKRDQMMVQRNEWLAVKPRAKFGPELGFGHVIKPYLDQQQAYGSKKKKRVLLLKACIGNRSLGWDLLPPGSPQFEHEDGNIYAGYKESPNFWKKGTDPVPINWHAVSGDLWIEY
jgi:hypothetical protein